MWSLGGGESRELREAWNKPHVLSLESRVRAQWPGLKTPGLQGVEV